MPDADHVIAAGLRANLTAISPINAIANRTGKMMIASIPVFAKTLSATTGAFGVSVATPDAVVAGTVGWTGVAAFSEITSTLINAEALSTALVGERH